MLKKIMLYARLVVSERESSRPVQFVTAHDVPALIVVVVVVVLPGLWRDDLCVRWLRSQTNEVTIPDGRGLPLSAHCLCTKALPILGVVICSPPPPTPSHSFRTSWCRLGGRRSSGRPGVASDGPAAGQAGAAVIRTVRVRGDVKHNCRMEKVTFWQRGASLQLSWSHWPRRGEQDWHLGQPWFPTSNWGDPFQWCLVCRATVCHCEKASKPGLPCEITYFMVHSFADHHCNWRNHPFGDISIWPDFTHEVFLKKTNPFPDACCVAQVCHKKTKLSMFGTSAGWEPSQDVLLSNAGINPYQWWIAQCLTRESWRCYRHCVTLVSCPILPSRPRCWANRGLTPAGN